MTKAELLAPAGNYESFLGAIHAGADAVYLGGEKFGARAFADNFTKEQLCDAIRYAHLFSRKVYLTLNTLVKEEEMQEVCEYVLPFYQCGLDGIIVQDMGILCTIRKNFPGLPIHISTQMTVTGALGAKFLKDEGACRVVPARELSLKEIQSIKDNTGLEMETFIHGAMCYCYSGQCLFSSILGGRSGNRGKCAQPCRLPYRILEDGRAGEEQYPLSLKDMCTIEHIPALIRSGIDSFKIEGRMKKPEYAAGVTAIYRKYIDKYYADPNAPYQVTAEDRKLLASLYIRSDIQDGYYFRHNGADMVTLSNPAYNGCDDKLLTQIRDRYITLNPIHLPINGKAVFLAGKKAELTLSCGRHQVTATGETVQLALKQPVTRENIEKGLDKLGNTVFSIYSMDIVMDDNIFYPLKAINELRRSAVADLETLLLADHAPDRTAKRYPVPSGSDSISKEPPAAGLRVLCSTASQLEAVLSSKIPVVRLYLDSESCETPDELHRLMESTKKRLSAAEVFIALPHIVRQKDHRILQNLLPALQLADGCLFRNMESYAFLVQNKFSGKLSSDASVYIWNRETLAFWAGKDVDSFCLPYELNMRELGRLISPGHTYEQIVYGRIPMMLTANCIAKTSGNCPAAPSGRGFALQDRYRKEFPVSVHCRHCYNIIYNSVPLSLHDTAPRLASQSALRVDFTLEKETQAGAILRYFHSILTGQEADLPYKEYTTGHSKRGVE